MNNIVIVLNYNDSKNCLKLYNQVKNYKCIDKIIFIDNNSDNSDYKSLKKIKDLKVNIIRNEFNKGYAYGNNCGIKYAIKKYGKCNLIISNPDVEIEEKDLEGLINQLNSNDNISVIAPTIREGNTLNRGWKLTDGWDELRISIPKYGKNRNKIVGYSNDHYKEDLSKVDVVSGCFFIIKSDVIQDINFLDENTFLYYEENILGKKLKDNNYNVYVSNKYSAVHNRSQTVDRSIKYVNKFKILKKSQKYYLNNYTKTNFINKMLIFLFLSITLIGIRIRSRKYAKEKK